MQYFSDHISKKGPIVFLIEMYWDVMNVCK